MQDAASHDLQLQLMVRGFQVSRMLRLVAELGVADLIAQGERPGAAVLASQAGVLPRPLLRVLRALAAFGVFEVDADERVGHSPLSLRLRSDAPNSQRYAALAVAGPGSWRAWDHLDAALGGDVPHRRAWGCSRFEYLAAHPAEGRSFDLLMSQGAAARHAAVAAAYDFRHAGHIVDVGGGNGGLLQAVLASTQGPRGTVFDRDDVVAAARQQAGQQPRLVFEAGDFFEQVPAGADLYLLSRVLHDWPDADALRILGTCRRAMRPGARLLVVEMLLPADPAKAEPMGHLGDVHMMAMFGEGRERTLREFEALLDAAGFASGRTLPCAGAVTIVEASPR